MENNDLKLIWKEMHINENEPINNIRSLIQGDHSNLYSRITRDQYQKIFLYLLLLIVYICLVLYGFAYLKVSLSILSNIPIVFGGIFILIMCSFEISKFLILKKSFENKTIQESSQHLIKFINKINRFEIVINSCFFYAYFIFSFVQLSLHKEELKYLNNYLPFIIIVLFFLLVIPLFLYHQQKLRYKNLISKIQESLKYMTNEDF